MLENQRLAILTARWLVTMICSVIQSFPNNLFTTVSTLAQNISYLSMPFNPICQNTQPQSVFWLLFGL